MTKEDIYSQLKPHGCVSVYMTGSSANPYIQNPRDEEFVAVFDTLKQVMESPKIYNVHKITRDYVPQRWFIWRYLNHYFNSENNYVGEKITFPEPTIEELLLIANGILNSDSYKKDVPAKWTYHVAMVKAIERYGYNDIPASVVAQINALHDETMSLSEFNVKGE